MESEAPYFSGREIAAALRLLQEHGYLHRPQDDPLMSQLVDSRIVEYRPFYESDDRDAFHRSIDTKKSLLVAATHRNDFRCVIRLATALQETGRVLDEHVWAPTIDDLTPWIEIFESEEA